MLLSSFRVYLWIFLVRIITLPYIPMMISDCPHFFCIMTWNVSVRKSCPFSLIYILMHYSLIYLHQGRLIDIYLFFGSDPKASFVLAVKSLCLSLVSIQYTHIFPIILFPRWLQLNIFILSILSSEKQQFTKGENYYS